MPLARQFAAEALAGWEIGDRDDDVLICVSELVTNALLHGAPPGRGLLLRLRHGDAGTLRIEVHDSGGGHPRNPDPGGEEESGRGLLLVEALSDHWGVTPRHPGKVVWCEFAP